jgi:16S rRNA (guanine(527)-N(7))-methyltransferase RsmG
VGFRELLSSKVELTPDQLNQLERHYTLLNAWNASINLTRITDIEESVEYHYCESIFAGRSLPPGPLTIADVGSGAGFPGIPLAIVRPECQVTLIESHQRKSVFLREAARELKNVRVVAKRAEAVPETFDFVVSRAVRPAEVLGLRLSRNFAILMSETDLPDLPPPTSVTKLPWGKSRVLGMFHVEHSTRA